MPRLPQQQPSHGIGLSVGSTDLQLAVVRGVESADVGDHPRRVRPEVGPLGNHLALDLQVTDLAEREEVPPTIVRLVAVEVVNREDPLLVVTRVRASVAARGPLGRGLVWVAAPDTPVAGGRADRVVERLPLDWGDRKSTRLN